MDRLEGWPQVRLDVRPLSGEWAGYLRVRVGEYRIVFRVDEAERTIWVVRIAARGGAYD